MYLLERLYSHAITNDARWNELASTIGFDTYTRANAISISGNDFMYITASLIEGRDYPDFFTDWAIGISNAAIAQVASYGPTETVPAALYYSDIPLWPHFQSLQIWCHSMG